MALTTGTETRPGSLGDESKEETMAGSDKVLINLAAISLGAAAAIAFVVVTLLQIG